MQKVLVSLPDRIAAQLRAFIPARKRSELVATLLEKELAKYEDTLYKTACAAEKDRTLSAQMGEWDTTLQDGLTDESW